MRLPHTRAIQPVQSFIDARLRLAPNQTLLLRQAYGLYDDWCVDHDYQAVPMMDFADALAASGYRVHKLGLTGAVVYNCQPRPLFGAAGTTAIAEKPATWFENLIALGQHVARVLGYLGVVTLIGLAVVVFA